MVSGIFRCAKGALGTHEETVSRSRGFDWFCVAFKISSQVQVRLKLRRIFYQQNSKSTVSILNVETVIAVACRKKLA